MSWLTITASQITEIQTALQDTFWVIFDTVIDFYPVLALLLVVTFAINLVKWVFARKKIR